MAAEMNEGINWKEVARLMLTSRSIDEKEENELVPQKKVLYQFSARGHELAQILLGMHLSHEHDSASAYYRSRPLMLTLGLGLEDAMAAPMGKSGGYSDGRDIGVVCNLPGDNGPVVLPMAGDVGSQYTPAAGWAQAIEYHRKSLKSKAHKGAISVILGGDGSVATNGFWSAITMATTLNLPILFFIEDNGYGISVGSDFQTPGANIANNLRSFKNLRIFDGDGTVPEKAAGLIGESVTYVRNRKGPALIRLTVPRLNGHSYQDNQSYKEQKLIEQEKKNDPLDKLKSYVMPGIMTEKEWDNLKKECEETVHKTAEAAWNRPDPDTGKIKNYVFSESSEGSLQKVGGLRVAGYEKPEETTEAEPEKQRKYC